MEPEVEFQVELDGRDEARLEVAISIDLEAMPTARTLDGVLALLRARAAELRRDGVLHVAIFGSVARGEEIADSDVDIMVDLDPARRHTLLTYVRIVRRLEALVAPLGRRIDVAQRRRLRPHVRPAAERDAVQAF